MYTKRPKKSNAYHAWAVKLKINEVKYSSNKNSFKEGAGRGVVIPIPSTEVIKNPDPNEKNLEIPKIGVFYNPNLLFCSQILVPTSPIPFSILIKRQTPVPNLPLPNYQ